MVSTFLTCFASLAFACLLFPSLAYYPSLPSPTPYYVVTTCPTADARLTFLHIMPPVPRELRSTGTTFAGTLGVRPTKPSFSLSQFLNCVLNCGGGYTREFRWAATALHFYMFGRRGKWDGRGQRGVSVALNWGMD